jgi:hypothetical protein
MSSARFALLSFALLCGLKMPHPRETAKKRKVFRKGRREVFYLRKMVDCLWLMVHRVFLLFVNGLNN